MPKLNTFSDKIALVTGASKGIGKAIALELSSKGAIVIIHYYKDSIEAESVCKEIKSNGGKAYAVQANLTEEKDRISLKNAVTKIANKLDILVNNAGMFYDNDNFNSATETFDKLLALHVTAVARLCSLFKPILSKDASIINISSIHGIIAKEHAIAYSASKAATNSLTQSLAQAYAPIRVNSISPGPVETDMWNTVDKKTIASVAQETLLKRFGKPIEIAKVVAFLASVDASYITGANIVVDGGTLLY